MHTVAMIPHNRKAVICIVLHKETLERMQGSDPAIVQGDAVAHALDPVYLQLPLGMIDIMICYEEDHDAYVAKCKELRDPQAVLKYLGRGWEDRPSDVGPLTRVRPFKGTE